MFLCFCLMISQATCLSAVVRLTKNATNLGRYKVRPFHSERADQRYQSRALLSRAVLPLFLCDFCPNTARLLPDPSPNTARIQPNFCLISARMQPGFGQAPARIVFLCFCLMISQATCLSAVVRPTKNTTNLGRYKGRPFNSERADQRYQSRAL